VTFRCLPLSFGWDLAILHTSSFTSGISTRCFACFRHFAPGAPTIYLVPFFLTPYENSQKAVFASIPGISRPDANSSSYGFAFLFTCAFNIFRVIFSSFALKKCEDSSEPICFPFCCRCAAFPKVDFFFLCTGGGLFFHSRCTASEPTGLTVHFPPHFFFVVAFSVLNSGSGNLFQIFFSCLSFPLDEPRTASCDCA